MKKARRTLAIVSTSSIPHPATMFPMEAIVNPPSRGSRLDGDHPRNGVLIPCRFTVNPRFSRKRQYGGPSRRGAGRGLIRRLRIAPCRGRKAVQHYFFLLTQLEKLARACETRRIHVDKGYHGQAAGHNFSLLLRWLRRGPLRAMLAAPSRPD